MSCPCSECAKVIQLRKVESEPEKPTELFGRILFGTVCVALFVVVLFGHC